MRFENSTHIYFLYLFIFRSKNSRLTIVESLISKPVAASLNCSPELKRGSLKRFALKGRGASHVLVFKVKESLIVGYKIR